MAEIIEATDPVTPAIPQATALVFKDQDLVTVSNGIILEIQRNASALQLDMCEYNLKLYRRIAPAVNAAVARLEAKEPKPTN